MLIIYYLIMQRHTFITKGIMTRYFTILMVMQSGSLLMEARKLGYLISAKGAI